MTRCILPPWAYLRNPWLFYLGAIEFLDLNLVEVIIYTQTLGRADCILFIAPYSMAINIIIRSGV